MANTFVQAFESILNGEALSRVRRNHGLEHATLHVLGESKPKTPLAGHSDIGGFWILGDITTEQLTEAVNEALERLRGGERQLAVHPNCGTNFVTAGTFAGLAASAAMFGAGRTRDKVERLPLAATLATVALMASQPLGLLLQKQVTTSGEPAGLEIVEITPTRRGRIRAHRIVTRG